MSEEYEKKPWFMALSLYFFISLYTPPFWYINHLTAKYGNWDSVPLLGYLLTCLLMVLPLTVIFNIKKLASTSNKQ